MKKKLVNTMANNYYEQQRMKRVKALQEMIKNDSPKEMSETLAEASIEWGISRSTARDYLKTLRDANRVNLTDDEMLEWTGDE